MLHTETVDDNTLDLLKQIQRWGAIHGAEKPRLF